MHHRLVYYCRSHIWSINIFVLLQFEGNYFPLQSFLWCCQFQPGFHHHISSGESPTSLKTRVSVLRSPLSLSFAPEKLRILTPFSNTLYTLKIFSLKFYALKLNNGQRLKKLMYFFASVAYVVSYFALGLGVVGPLPLFSDLGVLS